MSGHQQSKKAPKRGAQAQLKTGDPILDALKACADAQHKLSRHADTARKLEDARRQAIRAAFAAGATAKELAEAVHISRAKIYQLIGSARALKH